MNLETWGLGVSVESGARLGFYWGGGGNLETNARYQPISLPEFKFSKMESELKRLDLSPPSLSLSTRRPNHGTSEAS